MDALIGRFRDWGRRLRGLPRGWAAAAISGVVFLILLVVVSRAAFRPVAQPPVVVKEPFELTAVSRPRRGSRSGSAESQPGGVPAPAADPAHLDGAAQGEISEAWAAAVAEQVRRTGRVCAIVHVGLAEGRASRTAKRGAAGDLASNAYWGARYGVVGFLSREGGWTLVKRMEGDGDSVVARVLLRRRCAGSAAWRRRGVAGGFDVYLLANAWPNGLLRRAMDAPARDGLKPARLTVEIDGAPVDFSAEAVMSGYIGPNGMAKGPWDAFEGLPATAARPFGVFYIASQSAAYVHEGATRRGLYSVLFARRPIVPEAYVLSGMLGGLVDGTLGSGFVDGAARAYAKYQKVSTVVARRLFFR